MDICKDCVNKELCKYSAKIEKLELDLVPEPLKVAVYCEHKQVARPKPDFQSWLMRWG